jgi:hypothetical protein
LQCQKIVLARVPQSGTHAGSLRPLTVLKALDFGYPASRANYGHSGRVCFLSAEISGICGYIFAAREHQREATRLPVPIKFFWHGCRKAALTGGLRPLTVFKAHESGHPASRSK